MGRGLNTKLPIKFCHMYRMYMGSTMQVHVSVKVCIHNATQTLYNFCAVQRVGIVLHSGSNSFCGSESLQLSIIRHQILYMINGQLNLMY